MSLTRKSTLDQLKRLRKETKGKDIGDLTTNDRLNKNLPNIQYIGNPIDNQVDTYEDFTKKDNKKQTISFKSKLVNKPLVKENKEKIMKDIENVLNFKDFDKDLNIEKPVKTKRTEVAKYILKEDMEEELYLYDTELNRNDYINLIYSTSDEYSMEELDKMSDEELDAIYSELNEDQNEKINYKEDVRTFDNFFVKESKKEKESEKVNPYGVAADKDYNNKKIAWFNNFTVDPQTPKERQILNAGQYIDNGKINGFINRIEAGDVYIESADDPMVIKKFKLKDLFKTKKED